MHFFKQHAETGAFRNAFRKHYLLHTPHPKLLHFPLHTSHFTLRTPDSTLHTFHSALHAPDSMRYTPHATHHTSQSTLRTVHIALHTMRSTLRASHITPLDCAITCYHSRVMYYHSTLTVNSGSNVQARLGRSIFPRA